MVYRVIHEPRFGAVYLEEGRWLFRFQRNHQQTDALYDARKEWVLRRRYTTTVTADSDGGCDRFCEHLEYKEPAFSAAVFEDHRLLGFYYEFEDYYLHRERTAVPHLFLLDRAETHRVRAGGYDESWELIRREPGKEYRDSQRIW